MKIKTIFYDKIYKFIQSISFEFLIAKFIEIYDVILYFFITKVSFHNIKIVGGVNSTSYFDFVKCNLVENKFESNLSHSVYQMYITSEQILKSCELIYYDINNSIYTTNIVIYKLKPYDISNINNKRLVPIDIVIDNNLITSNRIEKLLKLIVTI